MTPPLSSLQIMLKEQEQNSNSTLIMGHYPGLDSTSDWLCQRKSCFLQSELPPIPRSGQWDIISMKFLRLFLTCWFAGKLEVASQDVGKWHCRNYFLHNYLYVSLRKRQTFGDATTGFRAKWHLRNERRNSKLMTCHYPDLGNDASPVWNFRAHLSDVTWRGNQ